MLRAHQHHHFQPLLTTKPRRRADQHDAKKTSIQARVPLHVMENFDVIIVGGGPTGLALSIFLAQRGVKVGLLCLNPPSVIGPNKSGFQSVVLEQNAEIDRDPKAIALTGDALRITRLLGVGPEKQSHFAQRR